jgi:hypothetical protein
MTDGRSAFSYQRKQAAGPDFRFLSALLLIGCQPSAKSQLPTTNRQQTKKEPPACGGKSLSQMILPHLGLNVKPKERMFGLRAIRLQSPGKNTYPQLRK